MSNPAAVTAANAPTGALRPTPWSRLRDFGRPPRFMGLDLARAIAIIGMAGAHMASFGEVNIWQPETYLGVVHGRSSILFAVLAGISVAIMTGRTNIPEREQMPRLRGKLFGRGVMIFLFGIFCELLAVPVAVILTFYGVLYIVVMPFLRLSVGALLTIAVVIAVFGPTITAVLVAAGLGGGGFDFLIAGFYPLAVWLPLMLVGLAIGRLPLSSWRVAAGLASVGAGISVLAYGVSAALNGAEGAAVEGPFNSDAVELRTPGEVVVHSLIASYPHSGGTLEIFGSGGLVIAVIGVCLLLARPLRWPLIPVAALGSMPLTSYTGHLVIIVLVWGPWNLPHSSAAWAWTVLGLVLGCTVWMMLFGRGPLEGIVKVASDAMVADARPVQQVTESVKKPI
ncbi:heparan-alpha-glucosaminide N-acetyltransferase domain-containing protein [Gulosibacter chungangensis]|uniref:DUF1624 domain-containing protein n=1 Tax=Gulosibacter chungangensis TaxID=979746 RepID=A0A7J5BD28_9MICO|nr:heparan-alpha-glucosaminide N-acetyltransferase domain-containing protein [Gulosibacter chungangensis]KAB1643952.1 DUF1624 domain-containing protein [Gulosibacter chungangensis]